MSRGKKIVAGAALLAAALALWAGLRPWRGSKAWAPEYQRLAAYEVMGDRLVVRGLRNFVWVPDGLGAAAHEDREYDLAGLDSVWFALTPLSPDSRAAAHTFLTFGFSSGPYLSISAETRRRDGEPYSAWRGLFRRYPLCYVVADERDVLRLRVETRKAETYLLPMKSTPEARRRLLLDMLARAQALAEKPEFYNTLTNNCTTNILNHVNALLARPIPWGPAVLLPGYSDRLARRFDLLDAAGDDAALRRRFAVKDRAAALKDSTDFSRQLRQNL